MPRSLRAKLVFVVLLTTGLALAIALGAMLAFDVREWRSTGISEIKTQAEFVGQTMAPALSFEDVKTAQENLALLRTRPEIHAAGVYTAAGELFATYASHQEDAAVPRRAEAERTEFVGADLVVFQRIVVDNQMVGTVYLRARHDLDARLVSFAGIALSVAVVALAAAFVFSFWLQRILTRPILSISRIAREVVEQHDYSRRAHKLSDDEVGVLVESFNDMMAEVERHSQQNAASIQRIAQARLEIMKLNEGLEHRVEERTQQLMQANEELGIAIQNAEKANLAKSDFLSSMSHELRTPLNAILGFGQLLLMPGAELPVAKRNEFTQHILKAGRHLLNLITEILDMAKIESATMMMSLEPVPLTDVLDECRAMIEPAAQERGIRLELPPPSDLAAMADRTRLKQVFLNLLSNAIKYNRDDGSVRVSLHSPEPDRVRVSVHDTGKGLSREQLATLFQPFNRLGQEAGPIEGTGIGLVVTRRLTELMAGSVSVESTVGLGSVFHVDLKAATIPTAKPMEPESIAASDVAKQVVNHGVLLHIEDNPANLQLVEEIVRMRADLNYISAPDAQLGLQLARIHRPDVVLLDLNLPGLSGHDAMALLRRDLKTAHIPVIAVTANAMPRDIARGAAAGFFRYVTKPIDIEALNHAIDAAIAEIGA